MSEMFRRGVIKRTPVALLLLALLVPVGTVAGDGRLPDLGDCQKLQVEAGNRVAFWAYAEGVQIYRWNGTGWVFVAPEATLYSGDDEDAEPVAIHYAGPTWESISGSKVVGAVMDKCPVPNAIPWLLLKAASNQGPGIFHRVTFIQRLYTVGGVAPADPGAFPGQEARIPYSAWYVFYRAE